MERFSTTSSLLDVFQMGSLYALEQFLCISCFPFFFHSPHFHASGSPIKGSGFRQRGNAHVRPNAGCLRLYLPLHCCLGTYLIIYICLPEA